MLGMLVAYDSAGNIIATLDHLVVRDDNGEALGLADFAAHEQSGGKLRNFWVVEGATGSGVWPEWLEGRAHDFRVELDGKRIKALVHKTSGVRRERAAIEEAIRQRIVAANGDPADIRDLVGGPGKPLQLAEDGTNLKQSAKP